MEEDDLMRVKNCQENCHVLVNQFHGNIHSKTLVVGKLGLYSGM